MARYWNSIDPKTSVHRAAIQLGWTQRNQPGPLWNCGSLWLESRGNLSTPDGKIAQAIGKHTRHRMGVGQRQRGGRQLTLAHRLCIHIVWQPSRGNGCSRACGPATSCSRAANLLARKPERALVPRKSDAPQAGLRSPGHRTIPCPRSCR